MKEKKPFDIVKSTGASKVFTTGALEVTYKRYIFAKGSTLGQLIFRYSMVEGLLDLPLLSIQGQCSSNILWIFAKSLVPVRASINRIRAF
jgi:hypothetical protein